MLKTAPISFVSLLVLGLAGGFAVGMAFRSQELANVESLMRLKDGELDSYRKSIDERLNRVEKQLSEKQVSDITSALKGVDQGKVDFHTGKLPEGYSPETVEQLKDIFKKSGWTVETEPSQNGFAIQTSDPASTEAVSKAFGKAGIEYETMGGGVGSTKFQLKP